MLPRDILSISEERKEDSTPRKLLGECDRVDIYGQGLASNKFRHLPQRCSQGPTIRVLSLSKLKKKTQLASLGSVVVSGCPPLASRICRRVSLNSRPGTEAVAGAGGGTEVLAVATGGATPSRNAFSRAAFCARSRLSTSICALIAARAFLSFSFSERKKKLPPSFSPGEGQRR